MIVRRQCTTCSNQHPPPTGRRCPKAKIGDRQPASMASSGLFEDISEETVYRMVSQVMTEEDVRVGISQPPGNQLASRDRLNENESTSFSTDNSTQQILLALQNINRKLNNFEEQAAADRARVSELCYQVDSGINKKKSRTPAKKTPVKRNNATVSIDNKANFSLISMLPRNWHFLVS